MINIICSDLYSDISILAARLVFLSPFIYNSSFVTEQKKVPLHVTPDKPGDFQPPVLQEVDRQDREWGCGPQEGSESAPHPAP